MTRKDYIKIAAALALKNPRDRKKLESMVQWNLDCVSIANMLEKDNPKFDRDRFLKACQK